MIKSLILIILVLAISCNSTSQHSFTIGEFTRLYRDTLTSRFNTVHFTLVNDSTIESNLDSNSSRHSVDNAFREYLQEPDSLISILTRYAIAAGESFVKHSPLTINQIIPVIKPISYVQGIKEMSEDMNGKAPEIIYEKYNEDIIVAYAIDRNNTIEYLTKEDFETFNIPKDSLRSIATRNLENLLEIKFQGDDGLYMILAGGAYEASVMLINDIFKKDILPVDGDFVIAIPSRDLLLVTGSRNASGIEKIKKMAKEVYETGSYTISDHLYKWNGSLFMRFE